MKLSIWIKRALLLSYLLLPIGLWAQSDDYNIVSHYTNDNGLSQNEITDIALDNNGFLWICTQGGLLRFDGSKFWHYNSTNSILNVERTSRVSVSKSGKVFIQSSKLGDIIYTIDRNYRLVKDTMYSKYETVAFFPQHEPLPIDPIVDRAAKIYGPSFSETRTQIMNQSLCLSSDHHLYYVQSEKHRFRFESINIRSGQIQKYAFDADDILCRAILGDVLFFLDTNLHYAVISNGKMLSSPAVSTHFLNLIDLIKANKRSETWYHRQGANNSLIVQIKDDIWHVFNNNGILDATMIFKDVHIREVSTSIYDEKNKTLFIGTYTKGLYIIKNNPFRTILFSKTDPAKNVTYAQIQINSREVVNRYFKYSPYDTAFTPFKKWREISALYRTRDHKILYSTNASIVICDSNFRTIDSIPFPTISPNNIVGCFLEDEQNRIWFSGYNSLGFIKDGKSVFQIHNSDYFLKSKISTLFNLDARTLWIGHENGILSYNKQTGRLDTVLQLPGHNVRTIYRASDNSIWIGTYGKGFYKYVNGKFIAMPLDAEKHLLFTHSFNEDDSGFFWIPTNNGLLQCKKGDLDAYAANPGQHYPYYYYYRKSNRYTNEYNGGSNPMSVKFNDLLLLPSLEGVVSFAPNQMEPELPNSSLVVESITVDGKKLNTTDEVTLSPNFRQLELNISAPYMGDAINNILEYNLQEIGNTWYPVINGSIIYNQLPKGTYHLTIRKRLGFGINNYSYHRVTFSVTPFWYQTILFYVLVLTIVVAAIYLLIRLRFRVMKRKQQQLEKIVDERTETLQEAIAELHVSEEHLNNVNEIQEQAIAIILHDIQSPIRHLSKSANAFDKQLDSLTSEDIREYTKNLAESTEMINNFTGQLLNWLIVNRDNQKIVLEKIDISSLLLDIKNLYNEIAQINGNEIVIQNEIHEPLVTDRNKLALIIRNLVDNATKNCKNGTITLSCNYSQDHSHVAIAVKDTGRGMTPLEVQQLREPSFIQTDFSKEKLGFSLVRQFIAALNGYFDVESEEGRGTVINIFLPVRSSVQ